MEFYLQSQNFGRDSPYFTKYNLDLKKLKEKKENLYVKWKNKKKY